MSCNRAIIIDLKNIAFDESNVVMYNEKRELSDLSEKLAPCTSVYDNTFFNGSVLIGIKDSSQDDGKDSTKADNINTEWRNSDSFVAFIDDMLNRIITLQFTSVNVVKDFKQNIEQLVNEIQKTGQVVELFRDFLLYEQLLLLYAVVCRFSKVISTIGLRWITSLEDKTLEKTIEHINTCSFVLNVLFSKSKLL
ncbi:predicted protein [Naegleria gruberi]|uniref:Predicted protein n=1 Tax=Naegleria gruberi TaxID=5762 RepID=D2W4B0_NAEGR|nr:uncharacterized protein NAEGRDRAFT_76240 [Naegleria gruberi]EFC36100.1 predicted protein [Naegleria gruberi]|eukprot:XP_002668844.1 predicted protein [Naegleria gruberi strain NEG-M]